MSIVHACPLILCMLDTMVKKDYIGAITYSDTRRKHVRTRGALSCFTYEEIYLTL